MSKPRLDVEKRTDSGDESKPQEVTEQGHVELFGREFRIVQNGLDPEEVADYLRNGAGSSDAAFKQLEQFSAIQAVAKTMEESVAQAKQLAENARAQAEAEAQEEKARVIEDTRRQAAETIERVMMTSRTSIDAVHSALLDAIKDAFEKTKETTARILAEMEENAQAEVAAQLSQSIPDVKQPDEGASDSEAGDSETVTVEVKEETQSRNEGGPDLAGLYETSADLRESESLLEATIRGNSAGAEGEKPPDAEAAPQSEVEDALQGEVEQEPASKEDEPQGGEEQEPASKEDEPQGGEEQEPASKEDEPQDDEEQEPAAVKPGPESGEEKRPDAETARGESGEKGPGLYRGTVTVAFPERARASWMLLLRQRILETPGVQILGESYADKDGARLKLSLSEPLALPDLLRELPDVRRVTDSSSGAAPKSKGLRWLSGSQEQEQILVIELGGSAIRGETAPLPSASQTRAKPPKALTLS